MYGGCKNKTIYGKSGIRSIYGERCKANKQPICDTTPILIALQTLTQSIFSVVSEFFPAITANAQCVGKMNASVGMSPIVFVRMYWIKTHPGKKWTNSEYEQLELIDIYLRFPGLDWKSDYLLTVKLNENGME